jgi:hypothetical protein
MDKSGVLLLVIQGKTQEVGPSRQIVPLWQGNGWKDRQKQKKQKQGK